MVVGEYVNKSQSILKNDLRGEQIMPNYIV